MHLPTRAESRRSAHKEPEAGREGPREPEPSAAHQEPRKPAAAHSSDNRIPTPAEERGRSQMEPPQSRGKGPREFEASGNRPPPEASPPRAGRRQGPRAQVPKNRPTYRRAPPHAGEAQAAPAHSPQESRSTPTPEHPARPRNPKAPTPRGSGGRRSDHREAAGRQGTRRPRFSLYESPTEASLIPISSSATMNMLTVCALVCTIVALAGSADLPETKAESNERAKTHLVKRSSNCDDGWIQFNGRCFYYVAELMTWDKAEANCVSLGGHLASVHNAMEYCRLERLILSVTHEEKETWIGGTDAQEEGHWIWNDDTTFHFTNWCPGEPNNTGQQHCLQMNYSAGKCWDDLGCHKERPSVCARKM